MWCQLFWVGNLSRWLLPWGFTCLSSHSHGSTNLWMPWRVILRPMLPIWSLCSPEGIFRTQSPRTRHKPFREEWECFIENFSSAEPALHVLSDQTVTVTNETKCIPQDLQGAINNLASKNLLQKSILHGSVPKWICRSSKAVWRCCSWLASTGCTGVGHGAKVSNLLLETTNNLTCKRAYFLFLIIVFPIPCSSPSSFCIS